ncbi:MAG: MoxR family ATPase [Deinococcus sp.]|nr:MoxR family ATPase [Deinococcus sp.]
MPEAIEAFQREFNALKAEIEKVIIGQEEVVEGLLTAVIAGGHVLLEGVPGLGKTLLAKTFARATGLAFSRIQFTPDLMPADITGTHILNTEGSRRFEFQPGPIFGNVILADEINRATPKTQSAMLEAMQEGAVTVAGEHRLLPKPFIVLATQNPIELEGTYPLPEAQLDRFLFKLVIVYPSSATLARIISQTTREPDPQVTAVTSGERIKALGEMARALPMPSAVLDYTVRLVEATRHSPPAQKYLRLGASPRGGQALALGARVRALYQGRSFLDFSDVKAVAKPALRHRLILSFEAEADGISADQAIAEVLAQVPERP